MVAIPANAQVPPLPQTCAGCPHFDREAWDAYRRKLQSTKPGMLQLNRWSHGLSSITDSEFLRQHEGQDGEVDIEHALTTAFGICRAQTIQAREVAIMEQSTQYCPDQDPSGKPFDYPPVAAIEDEDGMHWAPTPERDAQFEQVFGDIMREPIRE